MPQPSQNRIGIGTPHARWRDRHQSGRFATMPWMRFLPHGGMNSVRSISASAFSRSPPRSIDTNHCGVARKITGFLQRQQHGYECLTVASVGPTSAPAAAIAAITFGLASKTFTPFHSGTSSV